MNDLNDILLVLSCFNTITISGIYFLILFFRGYK